MTERNGYLPLGQIWLHLYRILQNNRWSHVPGTSRLRRWTKQIIGEHYFCVRYLEGSVWVCPTHAMGKQVCLTGSYEPLIIEIIRTLVRRNFCFMDIGANIGLHTLAAAFARSDSSQRILAFEPEPTMFKWLTKSCETNHVRGVTCIPKALGEKPGKLLLNVSTTTNQGRHTLLQREHTRPGNWVEVTTLDDVLTADPELIPNQWVIKLDVEGFESHVIRGGKRWFEAVSEAVLICEISPDMLAVINRSPQDIITPLLQAGFEAPLLIKDTDTVADDGHIIGDFYNLLFVKGQHPEHTLQDDIMRYLADYQLPAL